jgi:putative transposase
MRNVLAHAGKQGRRVVAAFIGTAFAQDDAEAATAQWRAFDASLSCHRTRAA